MIRGMGDSTFSTKGDEKLTLEMMARDLLDLIVALNWKKVAICGYSMGGMAFLPSLVCHDRSTLTDIRRYNNTTTVAVAVPSFEPNSITI